MPSWKVACLLKELLRKINIPSLPQLTSLCLLFPVVLCLLFPEDHYGTLMHMVYAYRCFGLPLRLEAFHSKRSQVAPSCHFENNSPKRRVSVRFWRPQSLGSPGILEMCFVEIYLALMHNQRNAPMMHNLNSVNHCSLLISVAALGPSRRVKDDETVWPQPNLNIELDRFSASI